jgi:steroid delta-isomerase-like uncharacterized protein
MSKIQMNNEETNKASLRRLYNECLNEGKFEAAHELISLKFAIPSPTGGTGPESFKAFTKILRTAFPDIHFTVHEIVAEGERVALRWTWAGTHKAPFMNIPATQRRVTQEAVVIYRFESGMVVELNAQVDRLGFFQQLGVLPEMAVRPAALLSKP